MMRLKQTIIATLSACALLLSYGCGGPPEPIWLRTEASFEVTNGAGILKFTVSNMTDQHVGSLWAHCQYRDPSGAIVWEQSYINIEGLAPFEEWEVETTFAPGISNGLIGCTANPS